MDMLFLFRYLLRKKWLIIIPTVVAIIAAWFFKRFEPLRFTATSELSNGYMAANPFGDNSNFYSNQVMFSNVLQTLESRKVMDPVSYGLLLHDLKSSAPFRQPEDLGLFKQLTGKFSDGKSGLENILQRKLDSFLVLDLSRSEDKVIQRLLDLYGYTGNAILGSLEINRINNTDFIQITCTTENPLLSAFISNLVCDEFLNFYRGLKMQISAMSMDTLEKIVKEKKLLLDNKLRSFQSLGGGRELTVSSNLDLLGTLQTQLAQEKNNLIAAQVALKNINGQISQSSKQGGLSNNEDIISIRNRIDDLWSKYVNSGSNDENMLDQINKLRATYQQKLSTVDNAVGTGIPLSDLTKLKMEQETKVSVSQQTIAGLQSKITELQGSVNSSTAKEGMLQSMQNEIDVAKQEYNEANNRYNDAMNHRIFQGNDFKQTLVASPPLSPDPSKKLMTIGFAGGGVFFIIVFLILLWEFLDPSIKASSFLTENISIPLVTAMQRIHIKKYSVESIFNQDTKLPVLEKDFRNRVKQLRYEIEKSGNKIFLMTSCYPGAGKTTLIRSLARSLSLSNKNVLLIDANFRNNTLTAENNANPALEEFVAGKNNDIASLIKKVVSQTDDPRINIIGCKGGDYTPDEVLPDENLLAGLKKGDFAYDYVFIEGAALSKGPGSKELLKYVEGVIVVFSADQPLTDEDKKSVEALKNRPAYIGAVLNKVNYENINI